MATIQCKQCGGDVDLPEGMTSGVCPYCNSLTTFPKITDPRMEQLYARAEQFRRNSDFDKAVSAYEQLIQMDPEDPEYYWGLVISRYGIEYVEDPVSHERIPTCHRVQYDSILADADYRSALSLSSGYDRDIYEKEANRIAEIQKGILTISAQEKPYDVFICYKETTDGGTRTRDSTLAQDIYYQLTNIGYKVFFARITLEDKLGQQYEPYIFAALNSAKVMLVIGSKKEFFEAVWVRNEWSRFLALMKKDRTKLLIPCYSGMDPYDLPTELSMFQAQDMSKIGFLQDLIHGIKKVVGQEDARKSSSGSPASDSTQAAFADSDSTAKLLKRIESFLLDKNFDKAGEYCNKILDNDPDNLEACFYQLLVTMEMTDEMAWPDNIQNPEELSCCKKILASDNDALKQRVENVLKSCRLGKALIKYGDIFPEDDKDFNSVGDLNLGVEHLSELFEIVATIKELEDFNFNDKSIASDVLRNCQFWLHSIAEAFISEDRLREEFFSIDEESQFGAYEIIGDKDELFEQISGFGEVLDGYEGKTGSDWTEFFSQMAEENLTNIEAEQLKMRKHSWKMLIILAILVAILLVGGFILASCQSR